MDTPQDVMYEKVAGRCIDDFVNGYHGTLFAYGNSGSGKTYSIVGPDEIVEFLAKDFTQVPENIQELYGVIPRATIAIFKAINEYTAGGATASLSAAYIEIYNETITCLLNGKENLKVQEIPKVGFHINGNEHRPCTTPEDIFKVLYIGTKNKTVGGTLQNSRSSRSHTLLTLELKIKTVDGSERLSKLNIVDLAGSEKLKNTGASTPERIKEAQKINLSLTTLGMCIMALTENSNFVPFRNSKLTLLLKESLGGNSKTTLLCAARRDKKLVDDNLNSLYFAQRAKQIKTKSVKNVKLSDKETDFLINSLKQEIVQLRRQIKGLGQQFKPITDPKLLALLEGDIKDDESTTTNESENITSVMSGSAPVSEGGDKTNKGNIAKRTSLINLTEEEIIYKYCELRAKYDNLIESAGNKIFELNSRNSVAQIPAEQLAKMNEAHLKELEAQKAENDEEVKKLEQKIQDLEASKKKIEDELATSKEDFNGLQEMLDLNQVDIESMTTQLEEKEKEVKDIGLEKEDLKKQLEIKNQELQSKDDYIQDLLKQIQLLTETQSNKGDMDKKDSEIITLSKELGDSKLKLLEKEKEMNAKLLKAEEAAFEKEKNISDWESKYNNLIREHEKNLKSKETEIEKIQKENTSLQEAKVELESKKTGLEENVSSLENKITELKSQLSNLNISNKELEEVSYLFDLNNIKESI